jgi:mannose-1-phosphate guanylyltransferase
MSNHKISALLLAAGFGTRLKPFTDVLPKCLMPISGIPLLEIWLDNLKEISIDKVLVNLHYKKEVVEEFLNRSKFNNFVTPVYEDELLGTAGTITANYSFFKDRTVFIAHSDNLCICNFEEFLDYHINKRPKNTSITMMTFRTDTPETCGIVEINSEGIVNNFFEKVENPPGNLANAAIYLIEPEVIDWIASNDSITDFSNQVLPEWIGKIATWENKETMADIGNPASLIANQSVLIYHELLTNDSWSKEFSSHPIHKMIRDYN